MSGKDPDQKAVYYAESLVFQNTLCAEALGDDDINDLAEALFLSDWWQSKRLPVPILRHRRLEANASCATVYESAWGRLPEINFAAGQINAWTLTHEAAHVAQYHIHDLRYSMNMEDHGLEFRDLYVSLSKEMFGTSISERLHNSFLHNVTPRNGVSDVSFVSHDKDTDPDGLFQNWRGKKQVATMKSAADKILRTGPERIAGAIAL